MMVRRREKKKKIGQWIEIEDNSLVVRIRNRKNREGICLRLPRNLRKNGEFKENFAV